MGSYSIGVSGLSAAQKALDTIGNNVANATTPGYHRQTINLTPAYAKQVGSALLGGGVDFSNVTRQIDTFLEQEILRQQSMLEDVSKQTDMLTTVQTTFGDLSTANAGLGMAIDDFFNALQSLSLSSGDGIAKSKVVSTADAMVNQFETLGQSLTEMETQIKLEAKNTVEQINTLTKSIADLNDKIQRIEISGGQANNLCDQRDQCISDMSKLVGIETQTRDFGVVDVRIGGIAVVAGTTATGLEIGPNENNSLGVSAAGTGSYNTVVEGGSLGGLLSLDNSSIPEIHDGLDNLANELIQKINQYQVQGVGSDGSFTELTGWSMGSKNLAADFQPPITDGGRVYVRVTDESTGTVSREYITVYKSDTLSDIAKKFDDITGIDASVESSKLHIWQSSSNYKFDFLPAVLPEPTASNLTGTSPPEVSVSGVYTGTENPTLHFTVVGTGSVSNGELQLEAKNDAGEVIQKFNIGTGYAAGDKLDLGNGIKITLGNGDLNDGDTFDVDVFANTDTAGLLSAVGLNTFFSGNDASNIAVCSNIADSPGRIATALGPEMDNANVKRLAGLADQKISSLKSMTFGDFYRQMVTDIGQNISTAQTRQDSATAMVQNLTNQQSDISGVDINDQAAQMLVYQQMFQAMAKYLNTVQSSLTSLMEIV